MQSRAEMVTCNESTTRPFLASQLKLVKAAHCPDPGSCPHVTGTSRAEGPGLRAGANVCHAIGDEGAVSSDHGRPSCMTSRLTTHTTQHTLLDEHDRDLASHTTPDGHSTRL
eukprot:3127286-Rhodomonas_salina.2